jgi:uncharacterized protein YcfL
MMRKILLLLLVGALLVSCSNKEVKQVSQDSKMTLEAFALAETVKNAFIVKDDITLKKSSTETGYRDIMENTRAYDRVELTFTPRWVEIENNQLHVNIAWKSVWVAAGKSTEERGMAVFVMEGVPLQISKVLRGNPFVFPAQQ